MDVEKIKVMKEMIEIQGLDGNWNCDSYMHGMYNGMEFMLSIAEGRQPVYKEAPEQWKEDEYKDLKPIPVSG